MKSSMNNAPRGDLALLPSCQYPQGALRWPIIGSRLQLSITQGGQALEVGGDKVEEPFHRSCKIYRIMRSNKIGRGDH